MTQPSVELFVVGHSDAALAQIPPAQGITAVDLRPYAARLADGDLYAESAFLLADDSWQSGADFVGLCSASYDRKWPALPHLVDLPRVAHGLDPERAIGEELLPPSEWMRSAERNHPGLVAILERLASTFGLELSDGCRSPGANTFVCRRDVFLRFQTTFAQLLTTAIDWYGVDVPFGYRCPECGTVSESGYGRWTRSRHIGYLGERITRLIFSSTPDVTFVRPQDVFTPSLRQRLRAKMRRPAELIDAEEWHTSAHGFERDDALTQCPVCAAQSPL
jgi:hypothetical protein